MKTDKYKKEHTKEQPANTTIEGRNAVLEALNAGGAIDKIFIKQSPEGLKGTLRVIAAQASERGIIVSYANGDKLDLLAQSRNHQGVVALCPAKEYSTIKEILDVSRAKNEPPFILICDGITDSYNFGAILRTAAAGVHGVLIPKHRSITLSGQVSKSSAGAFEYIKVARVTNITAAIEELQKNNIWVYAADLRGTPVHSQDFRGAAAIVIGAEGQGISRLVRQKCDAAVTIPIAGEISSLNASVAAGVLMYEVVRSREKQR
ncbi:23S rRNA (guanosine(2251)-2'-O)-methyltransferase RlmB [Clostridia bacterium]|nr:23S rRNA (guanosine(2251)-2'-O)-methyltransferase RlmB [Clostridia bacterium]